MSTSPGQQRRRAYDLAQEGADYPARDGAPRRSILVCTSMRSGSTLLGEAMYFASGLGCPLEYYHRGFRPGFERRWGVTEIGAYTAALHRRRTDESGTFAVKLFWTDVIDLVAEMAPDLSASLPGAPASQWRDEHYRQVMTIVAPLFPNPLFIRLRRDDELAQAISTFTAGTTGRFRRLAGHPPAAAPEYDFASILQHFAAAQNFNVHWQRFLAANGLAHQTILYENLSADYDRTVSGLLAALGGRALSAPDPRLQRQRDGHSERLRERFLEDFRKFARGEG
ncbi:MAG: Stf0 family sulfotransferase [Pseudolabrys sp.]